MAKVTTKKQAPEKYQVDLEVIQGKKGPGDATLTHVDVNVHYTKDRANFFSGTSFPRGIYCSIGPVKLEKWEHGTTRSFGLGSAPTFLLEAMERLNRPKVALWFERVKEDLAKKTGKPWETLTHVLSKHNLSLNEEFKG